jgi:DivIVA domain-containing protein
MAVTPEEIEAKEFVVAIRGYDKDEVRAYLRQLAADLRDPDARRGDGSVAEKEFTVAMRGYDKDEVQAFLAEVAGQVGDALDAAAPPAAPVEPASGDADPFVAVGDEVASVLRSAQEAARAQREAAAAHAARVRADAEAEAERVLEGARARAEDEVRAAAEGRAAAEADATRVLSEADQRARRTVEEAETRAAAVEAATHQRLDGLRRRQAEVIERLREAEELLATMREDLGPVLDALDPGAPAAGSEPSSVG